jgi:hypothetical protein
MNVFSNTGFYEYQHDRTILKKLNNKIKQLRNGRMYQSKEILKHKIEKLREKIDNYCGNNEMLIKKLIKRLNKHERKYSYQQSYDSIQLTDKIKKLEKKIKYCQIKNIVSDKLLEKLNRYNMKHNDKNSKIKVRNYRKRTISKYDMKKSNLIDELHWKTITDIIKTNDFIFYGDIKSHNIVKHKSNHILNKNTNDLKFYKFKQRLREKAKEKNKVVYLVNESFTTQTCSTCGNINKLVGSSEIYKCKNKDCKIQIGRDINAAKNILMKGIVNHLL